MDIGNANGPHPSQKSKIVIWLYDNADMRIEGRIIVSYFRMGLYALIYYHH